MDGLRAAAERHLADPGSPDADLLAALAALDEPLVPHLAREELEMRPVVSASISHAEWVEWHESMVEGSMTSLAFEGHWLIDGLDEESVQVVVGPVPAVQRFILVKLLGGASRRRRANSANGVPCTYWSGSSNLNAVIPLLLSSGSSPPAASASGRRPRGSVGPSA